jgi:hypothetical protein
MGVVAKTDWRRLQLAILHRRSLFLQFLIVKQQALGYQRRISFWIRSQFEVAVISDQRSAVLLQVALSVDPVF